MTQIYSRNGEVRQCRCEKNPAIHTDFNWCMFEVSQEPRVLQGAKNLSTITFFLQAGCAGLFVLYWSLGMLLPFGTCFPHLQAIKTRSSHKPCKCCYVNCIVYTSRKENSNSHFPTSFVIEECSLCHQAPLIRKRTWQKHFKWQKTVVMENSPSTPSPNTLPIRAGKVVFLLHCVKPLSSNSCGIL